MRVGKYILLIGLSLSLGCEEEVVLKVPENPFVTITSPTKNSIVSQNSKITVVAFDDEKIVRVQILINNNIVYTDDSLRSEHSIDWPNIYMNRDGLKYVIEAIAYDNRGNKTTSNLVLVTYYSFTPDLYSAKILSDSLFEIKWVDNSTFEKGFEVEMAVNDSIFFLTKTVEPNFTSAIIKHSVLPNTNYFFKVRAISDSLKSPYSKILSTGVTLGKLYSLTATLYADTMVNIYWSDTNKVKDSFIVTFADTQMFVPYYNSSKNIKYPLLHGVTYDISVSPVANGIVGTPFVTTVSFKLFEPSALTSNGEYSNKIVLDWNDYSNCEKGFIIFRGEDLFNLVELARVSADSTGYTDTNLDTNKYYVYAVQSFTKHNKSQYSNKVKVAYKTGLSPVTSKYFIRNFLDGIFSGDYKYFFKFNQNSISMFNVINLSLIRDFEAPVDTKYLVQPKIISSYDGAKISSAFTKTIGTTIERNIGIWNSADGTLEEFYSTTCTPIPLSFSLDNSILLFKDCSNLIANYSPGGTSVYTTLSNGTLEMAAPSLNLIFVSNHNSVKVYNISDASLKFTIPTLGRESLLGYSSDGKYLVTYIGGAIYVYDIVSASKVMSTTSNNARAAHFSSDNQTLFIVGTNEIINIDMEFKKQLNIYRTNDQFYHSTFSNSKNQFIYNTKSYIYYNNLVKRWTRIP